MRHAIIQDNKVINIAVADSEFASKQGWIFSPDEVQIGWTYENGTFSPPERNLEQEWNQIRKTRNSLLEKSDIYVLSDRWESMTNEKKQEWSDYRQNLRDIPENFEDPLEVVWPTIPE